MEPDNIPCGPIEMPVEDVAASAAFCAAIGFRPEPMPDGTVRINVPHYDRGIFLMTKTRFLELNPDARKDDTFRRIAVCVDEREQVDTLADKALAAGATAHGSFGDVAPYYARTFEDRDGHIWEVISGPWSR